MHKQIQTIVRLRYYHIGSPLVCFFYVILNKAKVCEKKRHCYDTNEQVVTSSNMLQFLHGDRWDQHPVALGLILYMAHYSYQYMCQPYNRVSKPNDDYLKGGGATKLLVFNSCKVIEFAVCVIPKAVVHQQHSIVPKHNLYLKLMCH